ncbi:TRAP transporter substrate-binding protein DctP [Chelativorans salis]|uniref:TRAP transporter substrate-binding protein DctP n=1 Tax=Chelativorans salis TaxID=2978478 RepID=A0ABT2LTY5_9HYPH|nr:TRAP transporter substrate-binding protein DctP [Chelativorans sp. EGI FJ00035]MCT7376654.1 TRAP transporter substrate-binding protein DctP [Chelativorans sp. EGI FJ00035]
MRILNRLAGLAGILAAATLMTAGPALAQLTIKYGHYQPGRMDQPKHAAAMAFKSYVEGATGGEINVEIYPAGQLGNEQTTMEGLQLGTIEMAVVHDGGIAGTYTPIEVFSLPFAFDNQAVAWNVFDGPFGQKFAEDMLAETQIRLFGFADNGVRHFTNSKHPVKTPEDLQGLKIRVQPSQVYVSLVESLGGDATAIAWGELPTALAQGTVDGQENGVTNILAASLYENQKHVTLDGHVFSLHAYMMSDAFWQQLTPEQQKIIEDGTRIAIGIHRGMTAAQDSNASTILADNGMTVTTLTPQERDAFRKLAQPAVRAYLDEQVGADLVDGLLGAIDEAGS